VTLSRVTLGIRIKCHHAESRYAECLVLFIVMLSVIVLNVVILVSQYS